jgi:hypothetical protein
LAQFYPKRPFEIVRFFWWFLYQRADELDLRMDGAKRKQMLGVATLRYWYLYFKNAVDSGAKFVETSGPLHMESIERQRKAQGVYPSKVDDKPMGRLLRLRSDERRIDGKTIARWRNDMAATGSPPFVKEDGSFALRSQEEFDAIAEYCMRSAAPRMWRRVQRRCQRNSE